MRIKRTKAHFAVLDWADGAVLGIIHDAEIDNPDGLLLRIIECLEDDSNVESVEFRREVTPITDEVFDVENRETNLEFKITEEEDYPGGGTNSYYFTITLQPVFAY